MNTGIFDEASQEQTQYGPGSHLRLAREQAGMTVSTVASYLHLTSQLIRDIENDDYSRAPQPVFLRGYLRAYAKLLGIRSSDIIDLFNDMPLAEEKSASPVFNVEEFSPRGQRHWLLWLISLGLLLSVVMWFQSKPPLRNTTDSAPMISLGQATDSPAAGGVRPKNKLVTVIKSMPVTVRKHPKT